MDEWSGPIREKTRPHILGLGILCPDLHVITRSYHTKTIGPGNQKVPPGPRVGWIPGYVSLESRTTPRYVSLGSRQERTTGKTESLWIWTRVKERGLRRRQRLDLVDRPPARL